MASARLGAVEEEGGRKIAGSSGGPSFADPGAHLGCHCPAGRELRSARLRGWAGPCLPVATQVSPGVSSGPWVSASGRCRRRTRPDRHRAAGETRSSAFSISAIKAMMSDTTPLGTVSSAHVTTPFATPSRSTPDTMADRQCRLVSAAAPRTRTHAYTIVPATRNRTPAIRNGGIVSMA